MVCKRELTIPQLSGDAVRRVYVYLPESYRREPEQRYPVMYMFDGHNVFFDEDAAFGRSWRLGDYLDAQGKELIVIAVECNHSGTRRLSEYSPVSFSQPSLGRVTGRGRVYMKWLVQELKPAVDAEYRTLPDRAHTILAGSSMGGLMALYGAAAFSDVFRSAACLSPSLWIAPGQLLELIARARIRRDTCIYMDYGELELDNHPGTAQALISAAQLLMVKGVSVTMRIAPGGSHCEASWEKQIPVFMQCLGL